MWHTMIEGWQCCEGFGCRTAFPQGGDPTHDTVGFDSDGSLLIVAGGQRRGVPAAVLAWLSAPFGSTAPVAVERTCKNCKHWSEETQAGPQPCQRIVFLPLSATEAPLASLSAFDIDAAELQTLPDFGCALFETKEVT
jgi:hypothetical protein